MIPISSARLSATSRHHGDQGRSERAPPIMASAYVSASALAMPVRLRRCFRVRLSPDPLVRLGGVSVA